MHGAVVAGLPIAALAAPFVFGLLRRGRAVRRAALFDVLALAACRGVPLAAPLHRAAAVAPPRRAVALQALAADLDAGRPLADALRDRLPHEVPAVVAASLAAGERASRLPQALDDASAEASRDLASGHRLTLAAFYPALLFVGIALLHVQVLTPRLGWFSPNELQDVASPFLPAVTAVEAALVALGLALVCVPLVRRLRPLVDGAASARFLRSVGLLLQAGCPAHAALLEGADAAGVARLARAARRAGARVADGASLADAWQTLPLARAARERLAAASPTGLPGLVADVAAACDACDACDARAARRVERWVRWTVPVATVAAGLLVALDYAVLTEMLNAARDQVRPW